MEQFLDFSDMHENFYMHYRLRRKFEIGSPLLNYLRDNLTSEEYEFIFKQEELIELIKNDESFSTEIFLKFFNFCNRIRNFIISKAPLCFSSTKKYKDAIITKEHYPEIQNVHSRLSRLNSNKETFCRIFIEKRIIYGSLNFRTGRRDIYLLTSYWNEKTQEMETFIQEEIYEEPESLKSLLEKGYNVFYMHF